MIISDNTGDYHTLSAYIIRNNKIKLRGCLHLNATTPMNVKLLLHLIVNGIFGFWFLTFFDYL